MRRSIFLFVAGLAILYANAKVTAAPFYTETFDTGLPLNWSVGSAPGLNGSWKWYPMGQQSTSLNAIGVINTSTGFMIYDSDSIGTANPGKATEGWLKSAVIDCSTHGSVALTFDEYFRRYSDSCFVDVSTSAGFGNYTRYSISPNNVLNGNEFVPGNPYNVFLNITSAAASHSTVYLRFYYYGPVGGGYSWQIDNLALTELPPVNVSVHNSFMFNDSVGAPGFHSTIGNVPLKFADSVAPMTMLDNNGANAQAGFMITAKIFKDNILVYTDTVTVDTLPVSANDSLYAFSYFHPAAVGMGSYFAAFNLSLPGNDNTAQVNDTVRFSVGDTLWSQHTDRGIHTFVIHKPASQGEASYYLGTRFDVPKGASDTLSGISVAFGSETTPGTGVRVQVYRLSDTIQQGWIKKYRTWAVNLSAADISGIDTPVYKFISMQLDSVYPIITEGTWAAVVTPLGAVPASVATVLTSNANPATGFAGYFGETDVSSNDDNYNFGVLNPYTGISSIPMIRLHFSTNTQVLGLTKMTGNISMAEAYPNPADDIVHVPLTLNKAATVDISVMNAMGQVIARQRLEHLAIGQRAIAAFPVRGLSAGTYFYSIDADGETSTGRFTVKH